MSLIHRRTLLKGAGVALSLPLLDAMRSRRALAIESGVPTRRMVVIGHAFGLHAQFLFPKKAGRDYETTPYLEILRDYREQLTIISGTSHPDVDGGHLADKSFLTAAPHPTSTTFKNSISIDQLAAEHIRSQTRFSFLSLTAANCGPGLSYSRSGVAIPADHRPSQLFGKLFLDGKPEEKHRQIQRLKDGQSIMDTVLDRARQMQRRVGTADRDKLDQYFTSVRATEQRLAKAEVWEHKPKPQVNCKPPQDVNNNTDLIGRARLMYDLMHHALQSDSTRLITFYNPRINVRPPIEGVTQDYHNLSHHGQDPARLAELKLIESEHLKLFATFLGQLREVKEGSGTLLDQTMVLLGSELGNAHSHDNRNLPIILAGGGFRHGQHLAFDPHHNYPLPNLYVSMLQQLGLEIDKFASSTGTMSGLESRTA